MVHHYVWLQWYCCWTALVAATTSRSTSNLGRRGGVVTDQAAAEDAVTTAKLSFRSIGLNSRSRLKTTSRGAVDVDDDVVAAAAAAATASSTTARFRASSTTLDASQKPTPSDVTRERKLQFEPSLSSTTIYWANYTVDFQLLRYSSCQATAAPVVRVYCAGGATQVVRVSDPSIVCDSKSRVDADGWSYLECTNTCGPNDDDSTCDASSVYLQSDGGPSNDGPFARIEYSCLGRDIQEVVALATFVGSNKGFCDTPTTDNTSTTLNATGIVHILRMGVLCPNEDGFGNTSRNKTLDRVTIGQAADWMYPSDDWVYTYDDYFMECFGVIMFGPNGEYQCAQGQECEKAQCTTNISSVNIMPTLEKYQAYCVQTSLANIPAVPTPSPISLAVYSVTFEARWSLLLYPADRTDCLFGLTPIVELQCKTGGLIAFVSSNEDSMNCTMHNIEADGVGYMVCLATNAVSLTNRQGVNDFLSVQYSCTGPVVPETSAFFYNNTASCSGSNATVKTTISHALQLGIVCGSGGSSTSQAVSDETFVECDVPNHEAALLDSFGNAESELDKEYTCLESVTLPAGSTVSQEIPLVFMSTDRFWATLPDEDCYTTLNVASASSMSVSRRR